MLNAIKLYDGRSKIIRPFEKKDIKPSDYPHNAKFEQDEYDEVEKFEPKEYEESIGERVQLKSQKKI